jgi:predicted N-acetyltransferase YhbS
VRVCLVVDDERERAVAFLREQGARPVRAEDRVFAAVQGSEVVAAVRLAVEEGVVVLRGMRVREDHQRRGVGRALLRCTVAALGTAVCYCIPYRWLTAFYGEAGFQTIPPEAAPAFLASRHDRYVEEGAPVVVMRREGDHA